MNTALWVIGGGPTSTRNGVANEISILMPSSLREKGGRPAINPPPIWSFRFAGRFSVDDEYENTKKGGPGQEEQLLARSGPECAWATEK